MRFKLDWASPIVGSKFTVFALFYFVFEGNFPSTSPRRAYIWRGDLKEGFLRYRFGGLIHGGAYFRNFTVHCNVYVVTSLRVNSAKKLKKIESESQPVALFETYLLAEEETQRITTAFIGYWLSRKSFIFLATKKSVKGKKSWLFSSQAPPVHKAKQ